MIRCPLVLFALVFVAAPAFAEEVDQRFASLRDSAEPVGGLSQFLEKYIGECATTGGVDGQCRQAAAEFRRKMKGKKLFLVAPEESSGLLSPGRFDARSGEYVINVTPFFGAGGYGLSLGTPKKTDANGNPVLPYVSVEGETKDGWSEGRFQRMFGSREFRIQAVFIPQDVWSLPKKGGGKIHGVRAKFEAILVTVGRTGEQAALWMGR
ncbi:MAG: DUF6066 family protein [Myxococcaceae bacterium]